MLKVDLDQLENKKQNMKTKKTLTVEIELTKDEINNFIINQLSENNEELKKVYSPDEPGTETDKSSMIDYVYENGILKGCVITAKKTK